MQVEQFLERSAQRFPDKVALVCGAERMSYQAVNALCNRFANALVAHGIKRGDRVAICMDNCKEAALAIFATLKAGAVFVMLEPTTKAERLCYILHDCGATALVLTASKLHGVEDSFDAVQLRRC